jgi:hypothetical protein
MPASIFDPNLIFALWQHEFMLLIGSELGKLNKNYSSNECQSKSGALSAINFR